MKTPLDCIMERENNPQIIGEYVCLKTRMSAGVGDCTSITNSADLSPSISNPLSELPHKSFALTLRDRKSTRLNSSHT